MLEPRLLGSSEIRDLHLYRSIYRRENVNMQSFMSAFILLMPVRNERGQATYGMDGKEGA